MWNKACNNLVISWNSAAIWNVQFWTFEPNACLPLLFSAVSFAISELTFSTIFSSTVSKLELKISKCHNFILTNWFYRTDISCARLLWESACRGDVGVGVDFDNGGSVVGIAVFAASVDSTANTSSASIASSTLTGAAVWWLACCPLAWLAQVSALTWDEWWRTNFKWHSRCMRQILSLLRLHFAPKRTTVETTGVCYDKYCNKYANVGVHSNPVGKYMQFKEVIWDDFRIPFI